MICARFDLARKVGLWRFRVDQRIAVVLEDAESIVATNIDTRRLHEGAIERIDGDATGLDGFDDRSIGKDHA